MSNHIHNFSLRGFFYMLFAATVVSFASCEKSADEIEQQPTRAMELFYNESKGLSETSADSVFSFGNKFCDHMNKNLDDQSDELFQPTVDNLVYAASVFGYKLSIYTEVGVKVNTDWDGEYHINF